MVVVSNEYSLNNNVNTTLATLANRANESRKFDLNTPINLELYLKLASYNNILEKIEKCDTCYKEFKYSQIIQVINSAINKQ